MTPLITEPGYYVTRDNVRVIIFGRTNEPWADSSTSLQGSWAGIQERPDHMRGKSLWDARTWRDDGFCTTPHPLSYQPRRYDIIRRGHPETEGE